MDNPTKMDIVWMGEAGKIVRAQLFLYHPANQEVRIDWYKIQEGSFELYSGEPPAGPRFTLFLVDQIKSIEEANQKTPMPTKHLLKLNYLNSSREPLQIYFQQKEDLKSWIEALKKALEFGKKQRKKLEKQHKNEIKSNKSTTTTDENVYASNNVGDTIAFEVDVDSTTASTRNGVVGDGTIIISKNHITLVSRTKEYVITWNFKHVRRFGYSSTSFILEGGHKSGPKGEGLFMFSNCPGTSIRACIKARMAILAEGSLERSDSEECLKKSEDIYTAVKKLYKKLDGKGSVSKGETTLPFEVYAGFPEKASSDYEQAIESPNAKNPTKLSNPKPTKPPHKPTLAAKPCAIPGEEMGPRMSEVLQNLSHQNEYSNVETDNPESYSALSFCPSGKVGPASDLSPLTGNLYGEALCHQSGLKNDMLYSNLESEYSKVDYDKAKHNFFKKGKKKK